MPAQFLPGSTANTALITLSFLLNLFHVSPHVIGQVAMLDKLFTTLQTLVLNSGGFDSVSFFLVSPQHFVIGKKIMTLAALQHVCAVAFGSVLLGLGNGLEVSLTYLTIAVLVIVVSKEVLFQFGWVLEYQKALRAF